MYIGNKCGKCNRPTYPKPQQPLQQAQHQPNDENTNPWQYRCFKDKCCYFSPLYQTTCACFRLAPNHPTANASKTAALAKRSQYLRRHSHQNMTDFCGNYLLPAISAQTHSTAPSQPHAVNQLNGKLCTKCHQANPVVRQCSFADGHVQIPEDNVGKYTYSGEILF